jgi:exodeoxyribonuclease VII small subunit
MTSFEEEIQRLEDIVKILDRGDEPISLLLEIYEEGMSLADKYREYLDNAEQRVRIVSNLDKEIERQDNSIFTF